jgi:hypothetical protein
MKRFFRTIFISLPLLFVGCATVTDEEVSTAAPVSGAADLLPDKPSKKVKEVVTTARTPTEKTITRMQQNAVDREKLDSNFSSCKYELSDCKVGLLTDSQKVAVRDAVLDSNFSSCKYELSDCDASLLSTSQVKAVRQEIYESNFSSCKYELSSCKKEWLDRPDLVSIHGVLASAYEQDVEKEASAKVAEVKHDPYWEWMSRSEKNVYQSTKKGSNDSKSAKGNAVHGETYQGYLDNYTPQSTYSYRGYMPPVKSSETVPNYTQPTGTLYGSGRAGSSYYDYSYQPSVGEHYVEGYIRKDGTQVSGHYKTNSDDSYWNNWSSKGNANPYTGSIGSKLPSYSSGSTYVNGYTRKNGTYVSGHYRRK